MAITHLEFHPTNPAIVAVGKGIVIAVLTLTRPTTSSVAVRAHDAPLTSLKWNGTYEVDQDQSALEIDTVDEQERSVLLTSSLDGSVKEWHYDHGQLAFHQTLSSRSSPVFGIAVSPNGLQVACYYRSV